MFAIQNEYFCVIGHHIKHPKKCQSIMLKNKNTTIFLLNAYI